MRESKLDGGISAFADGYGVKENRSKDKSGRDSEYGKKILLGRGNSPKTKEYGLTWKKRRKSTVSVGKVHCWRN